MWEKEEMLVTRNFSFSHIVFKRHVSQWRQKASLCGNGLNLIFPFQGRDLFCRECRARSTLHLVTSNLSFSKSVFKRLLFQTRKNQVFFGKSLMVSFFFIFSSSTPSVNESFKIAFSLIFVGLVEVNATMNSTGYFENQISYFVQNR